MSVPSKYVEGPGAGTQDHQHRDHRQQGGRRGLRRIRNLRPTRRRRGLREVRERIEWPDGLRQHRIDQRRGQPSTEGGRSGSLPRPQHPLSESRRCRERGRGRRRWVDSAAAGSASPRRSAGTPGAGTPVELPRDAPSFGKYTIPTAARIDSSTISGNTVNGSPGLRGHRRWHRRLRHRATCSR